MLSAKGEYRGNETIGYGYARVHVIGETDVTPFDVAMALDDHEWNDQLRDGSFSDWTDAALAGCRFALVAAKKETGKWNITRIVGLLVDTTPEYVAIASARATWNAAKHDISDKDEESLRDFARTTFPKDQQFN